MTDVSSIFRYDGKLTFEQINSVYSVVEEVIDGLGDLGMKELLSGGDRDIDNMMNVMLDEACMAMYGNGKSGSDLNISFDYLDNLSESFEETLRCASMNYFILSVLDKFEPAPHIIEWCNLIQLYRLLCIIAARDHCFGHGTPVRMYDGSIKEIQHIRRGDVVMGADSEPRTVVGCHAGYDKMYRVDQKRADSYTVNSRHTLSLYKTYKNNHNRNKTVTIVPEELCDIGIAGFLEKTKNWRGERRGYKVCTHFKTRSVRIDEYFLGLWIGDGTRSSQNVTTGDPEIVDFLSGYAESLGCHLHYDNKFGYSIAVENHSGRRNPLLDALRSYGLIDNKHIPIDYLANSEESRLRLLAGLIDSDGGMADNNMYYTSKDYNLILDVKNLADSLGIGTRVYKDLVCNNPVEGYIYHTLCLSGGLDRIPCRLGRKKVSYSTVGNSYKKPKSLSGYDISVLSNISVTDIGFGKYYGIEIDGDNRFLLSDGTVVHNSKSYSVSFAYPLWKAYRYNPLESAAMEYRMSQQGMIVTNEFKLAKFLLSLVKDEIEENPILRERLYPNSRDGWGNEEIKMKNGAHLIAKSYGSKMRGYHPHFISVDDFLNESTMYSIDQKRKYISFFHSVIMNMIRKGCQVVVAGTPFISGDLYDDLKKRSGWKVFEYPAIMPDGRVLWAGKHTFDDIMAKQGEIGSVNFSREIMVKPISSASSVCPAELIKRSFVGMESFKLVPNIHSHPIKFKHVACGTDFAWSASAAADYATFWVIGMDVFDKYWLIHISRGKGLSYGKQMDMLKAINVNFRPEVFVIETVGAQKIFFDMAIEMGLPAIEHYTNVDKYSLYEGLPALAVLFERGDMCLPRGDEESIELTDLLVVQLSSFTYDEAKGKLLSVSDHDDEAMALWQAVRGIRYCVTGGFNFSFI